MGTGKFYILSDEWVYNFVICFCCYLQYIIKRPNNMRYAYRSPFVQFAVSFYAADIYNKSDVIIVTYV